MSQDHGAPGPDVVDVPGAFGIPEVSALRARHEARRTAHGAESANRGVDAARDDALSAFEQGLISGHVGGWSGAWCRFLCWSALTRLGAVALPVRGQGPENRSGMIWPMPGRKPASRAWSRKLKASETAASTSSVEARIAARADERVSPAPTNVASKRSNRSPARAPCGDASTLSMNWSGN